MRIRSHAIWRPPRDSIRLSPNLLPHHPGQYRPPLRLEQRLRVDPAEQVQQRRDQGSPARLVAGAQPRAVVAVEVLVEQDVVAPVRIVLEFGRSAVDRPPAVGAAQEGAGQPAHQLLGDLEQGHAMARAGGAFDRERVAVEGVEVDQRAHDQGIDRHPHRAAPVGVATEHAGVGFGRQVLHLEFLALDLERERMLQVMARQRADAVRAQELVLVEQGGEHALELLLVEDRQQPAAVIADEAGLGRRHLGDQLGMAGAELLDHRHQPGKARDRLGLDHRRGAERQQADQRAHLEAHRLAVGQPQHVVEEAVLLVPHLVAVPAAAVHGVGDPHEMLDELEGHLLIDRVLLGQDEGDLQHALAVERHPRRAVGLLQRAAGRQRRAAVEDADIVEAEEAAGEDVAARRVLAVDPPVEVQHQAVERVLEELAVLAAELLLVLVQPQRGPGVDRRIDVAEVPFVGRDLAAGMEVEVAQHQQELLLGEVEIDLRQGDGVEGEIPRRVPGILPLVGHRDHVGVQHVEPFHVPRAADGVVLQGMAVVLAQPALEIEIVELLAPQHAGQRLAVDEALVLGQRGRRDPLVEVVGLGDPGGEHRVEAGEGVAWRAVRGRAGRQAQAAGTSSA